MSICSSLPRQRRFVIGLELAPPLGGFIFFGDLVSKNIGVGQSDNLAPKIHQNTESLTFSIGQNKLSRKFGLNLTSRYMPLHDSRWNESHRTLTIQCTPVFGLRTSVKRQEIANHLWLNPFMVKCHVSPCRA